MCVPYTGTEAWTASLGYGVADSWRPWIVNEQVAGYILLEQITTFQHF
jgi:serine carboxypeptidase-like clade I